MPVAAYKVGFCPQCGTKIMVKDAKGNIIALRPNYRQGEVTFSDKHKLIVPICSKCLESINLTDIRTALIHNDSQGYSASVRTTLSSRGAFPNFIEKVVPNKLFIKPLKDKKKYGN